MVENRVYRLFGRRRALAAGVFALVVCPVVSVVSLVVRTEPVFLPVWDDWVANLAMLAPALACFVRAIAGGPRRAAAVCLGLGMLSFTAGNVIYVGWTQYQSAPPVPSPADLGFLGCYPCIAAAVVCLVRRDEGWFARSLWLDGTLGAVGAATALSLVLSPVLTGIGGDFASAAVVAAFPIADLLLVAMIVGLLASRGLRGGSMWLWLAGGLMLFCAADVVYALRVVAGTYVVGTPLDALWVLGLTVMALAIWRPERPRAAQSGRSAAILAVPMLTTLTVVAVLLVSAVARLSPVVIGLAIFALLLAAAKTLVSFRQMQRLSDARRQAVTDELTGLGNRRYLFERGAERLQAAGPAERLALVLIDLDNFKEVNDSLGHHAGDELLRRTAHRLAGCVGAPDLLVRLGGDEFALLLTLATADDAPRIAERILDPLREPLVIDGVRIRVEASAGVADMDEQSGIADLLRRADVAMYAAKDARSRVELFSPALDEANRARIETVQELNAHGRQVTERATADARYHGVSAGKPELRPSDPDRVYDAGRTGRWAPGDGPSSVGARAPVDHSRGHTAVRSFRRRANHTGGTSDPREAMSRVRIRLRRRLGSPQLELIGVWRVLPLLLAAGTVIVGMLAIADHARAEADRARQAQVVMEHLGAQSQRLDAITWRSLATSRKAARPAGLADGVEVYSSVSSDLRALHRLGVSDGRIARIEQPLTTVYRFGMQSALVARRDPAQARRIATTSFAAARDDFSVSVGAMARAQGESARHAQRRTGQAWIGSLLVGLFLLMLLGWRMHRVQRSAAMANAARAIERQAEQRLRALVRYSSDVVVVIDPSSEVRWIAESVHGMLGYEPTELEGRPLSDLLHPEDSHRGIRLLEEAVQATARSEMACLRLRAADGEYRHVEIIADNRLADPDIGGILLNLRDVSDRRALEEQLRHQSFHDSLTGLPNRALFDDRLTQALVRQRRHANRTAVVLIDVDDFKAVNDSLGHAAADEVLRQAAGRIHATLRAQDCAARLGGDEFAVLVDEVESTEEALLVAERIHLALIEPFIVGEHTLTPSVSIGVACPEASEIADTALGSADVAMYEAKQRGKGRIVVFEPAMRERVTERLLLTTDLASALENNELILEYQPVVELETGAIQGVEALLRWEHPVRGRLGPDTFIGLAEDTGDIVSIGLWVLEAACRQLRSWEADLPEAAALEMNVNVSTRQLGDPTFPASVRRILEQTELEPHRLTLEITESALLVDSDRTREQLKALKGCGILLAIDDFGTGYSALSYLQTFPIDVLKIDRSFVSGIDIDAEKAGLVQGIVEIGNNLNMRVVLEGIEEPGEASLLRAIHAGFGQGYLFSRPVGPRALAGLLTSTPTERIPELEIS